MKDRKYMTGKISLSRHGIIKWEAEYVNKVHRKGIIKDWFYQLYLEGLLQDITSIEILPDEVQMEEDWFDKFIN